MCPLSSQMTYIEAQVSFNEIIRTLTDKTEIRMMIKKPSSSPTLFTIIRSLLKLISFKKDSKLKHSNIEISSITFQIMIFG